MGLYVYQYIASGTASAMINFGNLIDGGAGNPLLEGKDRDSETDFQAYVEGSTPDGLGVTIDTDGVGMKLIYKNFEELQMMDPDTNRGSIDADNVVNLDEFVQDQIGTHVIGGEGIDVTYDDVTTGNITITATSSTFDAPRILSLTIDTPSRIDLSTDLNVSHTVSYDVMHYDNITSLTLEVTTGDNKTLTNPTDDGVQSEAVTLSGISTVSPGTVTFKITGVDTMAGTFESNTVTIDVRDLEDHEYLYDDLSTTNNPATITIATMDSQEVTGAGQALTISTGPVTDGDYFIILVRAVHVITIFDTVFMQNVTDIFTRTDDIRVINTHQFDSYVIGPLNEDTEGETYTINIVS